jgi:flavin reductase (DIM6/NTAB) family NADH-FMN oxidoreductase RutF
MKKPWNRPNLPVYSICSHAGEEHNMHIITYATAVSMQPKQFVVAVYNGTKTLQLVQANPHFVLQILAANQYNLVRLLGQQSGNKINKIQRLQKRNLVQQWNNFFVLKDALAYMEMRATPLLVDKKQQQPDHQLFLCDVIAHKNVNEGAPLTLDILRQQQIIRG